LQISKYFASMGIELDKSSVKKVDKALDHVENRLKKLGKFANTPITLSLGRFDVDQRRLNIALGNALDIASSRLVFEISRFDVNQQHLNRVMTAATIQATRVAGEAATIRPNVRTGVGSGRQGLAAGAVAGGVGGLRGMPNLFGPALALGLGGYGLGALNKRNQEVVAAQLQTQAVSTANGGTVEEGKQNFEWLRNQANRVGFNYLQASGDFNNLTANIIGAGGTNAQARNIFKGFSEYGRVQKLSAERQKLVFNALSQVAGKDKLQAEELTKQLGNSLPGAKDIFAQAYQQQTGGKLTGSEAIIALEAAMKKGLVRGDILNVAANIASQKAAPGIGAASAASQAEQAKYQNTVTDLAVIASNSGVEEGFARIFRTLSAGLSESNGLVRTLAEGFNEATKWADDLLLFPQSFIRALEGKDSVVSDWLGIDKTKQLQEDWKNIQQIFTDISSIKFDFLPTLESTAKEIASIMNAIAEFQKWKSGALPTEPTNNSATEKASLFGMEYASPAAIFGDIINNTGVNLNKARERGRAVYEDPNSLYYHDAAGYDDQQAEMAKAAAEDKAMGIVNNNSNEINIEVNVDGSTLQGMDANAQAQAIGEAVANMFVQSFDQVNVQFPVKQ
jgi:tape measure domain-containing protein